MYYVCSDRDPPIAHATLDRALAAVRGELQARLREGYTVTFNDRLEFELCRPAEHGGQNGAPARLWVQDEGGQKITSRDAAEAG